MRPTASFVGLTLCFLLSGCREETRSEVSVPEASAPDTNQPFTPPEIRRTRDSSAATPLLDTAMTVAPKAAPPIDPNHGARPALTAPTVPVAPAPAASLPTPKPVAPTPVVSTPPAEARPSVGSSATDLVGPGEAGEWTIQVGIHKSEEGARGMVAKLSAKGVPAYVVQAASNAGLSGSYWRVRVGRFVARGDAQKYGDQVLVPGGYSFWIDRKSNEAPAAGGTP